MILFFQKVGLFAVRSILSLCALLLAGLMIVQMILIIGINTPSTGRGSDFLSAKINQTLEDSGYQIGFDALYYDPVRGFIFHDFTVSDSDGKFLSLDHFSFNISFVLSPLRTLELSGKGGTMMFDRLPTSENASLETEQTSFQTFEMPDIYFRKIILSHFSFENIVLGDSIGGRSYEFSPSARGQAIIDDNILLSLTLTPGFQNSIQGLELPENINLSASLTPATLDFVLNDLSLSAPSYNFSMDGNGTFAGEGVLALTAQAEHKNLGPLTEEMLKEASAKIILNGPMSGPAIDISASLITGSLKERGLSDLNISFQMADITEGMRGDAIISTTFRDEPVTLSSQLLYEAPLLHLTDVKGTAPDILINGGGILSTQTNLFDGELVLTASDLSRYSNLSGTTLGGKLEARAELKSSQSGEQSAGISTSIVNGIVNTVKVARLSAQASFASLNRPWPQSAKIDAASLQISQEVTLDKLNANVTDIGNENYKLTLNGSGRSPISLSFDGSATLSNLAQEIPDMHGISFTATQGGSSVNLSGNFTLEVVNLSISSKNFRGIDIPVNLPSQFENLRIDLTASITGTPAEPLTNFESTLRGIGEGDYQNASIDIKGQHDGQTVSANLSGRGPGIRKLNIDSAMPMTWSILPFNVSLDQSAPLSGSISSDIDLAAIAPLFLPPTQSLSGTLIADGTIAGTLVRPAPSVSMRLGNAAFEDGDSGILVADINAIANLTHESLTLTSLSATDGKSGTISGGGSILFGNIEATNINLRIRDFNAPRSNLADGIIGGDLSLKGSSDGLHLSGQTNIEEMNIIVPETFSSRIPQLNIIEDERNKKAGILDQLTLDITIEANNQVFVRGWGLDAEFGGNIILTGTASTPNLNGTLSARRGRYEEFGKRFTLARADLRFQGEVPPSPYLDIEATTPAGDVTGSILLTGPVAEPSITFSSTPALPEDEVLSRILFGKDSARISAFQAVQLAQTLHRFSGQGGASGLDPLGMIRSATGLDDISIGTDETGETNVDVGKYLADDVYLELSKGKADTSGEATIQIEVTPSVNIESRIGQDAQGGGGIFWKYDY